MRNKALPALLLTAALLLSACTSRPVDDAPAVTETPTPAPVEPTPVPTHEPTPPAHSELYLPDVTTKQVLEYFNEVVLDMEYSDGTGNVTLVQKWTKPIRYRIYGSATDADLEVLNALFAQLNAIPGFPGIEAAEDGDFENLRLNFISREELHESFREVINGEEAYGAVQFWYYTESNELYDARIGYRTDLDQITRNSVLLEEIVNALGITDSVLRPDSIVYQYSNATTALSDIDWLILKLLYHPEIRCGMDAEACAAVIKLLYD